MKGRRTKEYPSKISMEGDLEDAAKDEEEKEGRCSSLLHSPDDHSIVDNAFVVYPPGRKKMSYRMGM